MTQAPRIETDRLILRAIDAERDFEPWAQMMADEETAKFIGGVAERATAWRQMCAVLGHWQVRGFGFLVVEEKATGNFAGRVGPWFPEGWPAKEVGWTIRREMWGRGYAVEAGAASLDWVFEHLGWDSVIHIIDPENRGSQRVAEKLGSTKIGYIDNVPPFGFGADMWGQSADAWRARCAANGG